MLMFIDFLYDTKKLAYPRLETQALFVITESVNFHQKSKDILL